MKPINVVHVHAQLKMNSAPNRIRKCVDKAECDIMQSMIVMHADVCDTDIYTVKGHFFYKVLRKISMWLDNAERMCFYHLEEEFPFSYYNVGINITRERLIKEADIIVLHWICASYISMQGLRRLAALHKPIIWICHDNWPFTGGCHVRMGCDRFTWQCGMCPLLHSHIKKDWSYRQLKAKQKAVKEGNITVVSPSAWMDENVRLSSLFQGCDHYIIPNPIDTEMFRPYDRKKIRGKYHFRDTDIIILFGAVKATTTPYKGYAYLLEALDILEKRLPEGVTVCTAVFGSAGEDTKSGGKIGIKYLGVLDETQMAEAYNLADVYVVPSLEDSFNSTVAECLSCAVPVAAFATGGIKDIIDHKQNGYLAHYRDAEDLAAGIEWVLCNNDGNALGIQGREKVKRCFCTSVVAEKYVHLYHKLYQNDIMHDKADEKRGDSQ